MPQFETYALIFLLIGIAYYIWSNNNTSQIEDIEHNEMFPKYEIPDENITETKSDTSSADTSFWKEVSYKCFLNNSTILRAGGNMHHPRYGLNIGVLNKGQGIFNMDKNIVIMDARTSLRTIVEQLGKHFKKVPGLAFPHDKISIAGALINQSFGPDSIMHGLANDFIISYSTILPDGTNRILNKEALNNGAPLNVINVVKLKMISIPKVVFSRIKGSISYLNQLDFNLEYFEAFSLFGSKEVMVVKGKTDKTGSNNINWIGKNILVNRPNHGGIPVWTSWVFNNKLDAIHFIKTSTYLVKNFKGSWIINGVGSKHGRPKNSPFLVNMICVSINLGIYSETEFKEFIQALKKIEEIATNSNGVAVSNGPHHKKVTIEKEYKKIISPTETLNSFRKNDILL